jgi:transcriptional regulator with XRE-family HTH domain
MSACAAGLVHPHNIGRQRYVIIRVRNRIYDVYIFILMYKTSLGAMITSQQMRAARALLGIDQRQLAALATVSLPTIQRMEASDGQVRGVVETLVKVIRAIEDAGVELIGENAPSSGAGRGVRLKETLGGRSPKRVMSMLFDQAEISGEDGNGQ